MGLGNKAQATCQGTLKEGPGNPLGKSDDDEPEQLAGKGMQAQAKGEHAIEMQND